VGEVLSVEPHPDADRLRLATVNYGGAEPQRVVCGAPNLAVGQRIAFGREGAELTNPQNGKRQKLKANKIRGVESSGMVLSEAELGISESHEGIIELPADAPIGMPLVDYLGDVVLDVHVWPNRADMMSMVGVAREVAAILRTSVREPDVSYSEGGGLVADAVSVEIEDAELCARYVATVIEGVQIAPSPAMPRAAASASPAVTGAASSRPHSMMPPLPVWRMSSAPPRRPILSSCMKVASIPTWKGVAPRLSRKRAPVEPTRALLAAPAKT